MITTKSIVIHQEKENIVYGKTNLTLSIEDEAGGYFIKLTDYDGNSVKVDTIEVTDLVQGLNILVNIIKELEKNEI